jgi:hypothetical protein
MAEIYRSVDGQGKRSYGDFGANLPGQVDVLGPHGGQSPGSDSNSADHKQAVQLIKEAQKRIPKIKDYLDYIDYLRHHDFTQFDKVMLELKDRDPETWRKLSQIPQFRSLRNTALGLKAGEKHLTAGASFVAGGLAGHPIGAATGSVEKWLETTVKDMMKRDRYGPYAPVLGTKASTLPALKAPTYSNSRLGQFQKVDDVQAAKAAKLAEKALEESRGAVRGGLASAISRPGGTLLDVGIGVLNPEEAVATTNILMRRRLEKLAQRNPGISLDSEAYAEARALLSQSRYGELDQFLKRFE